MFSKNQLTLKIYQSSQKLQRLQNAKVTAQNHPLTYISTRFQARIKQFHVFFVVKDATIEINLFTLLFLFPFLFILIACNKTFVLLLEDNKQSKAMHKTSQISNKNFFSFQFCLFAFRKLAFLSSLIFVLHSMGI